MWLSQLLQERRRQQGLLMQTGDGVRKPQNCRVEMSSSRTGTSSQQEGGPAGPPFCAWPALGSSPPPAAPYSCAYAASAAHGNRPTSTSPGPRN